MRTLEELKQDITAREADRINNAYMKKLGFWAAIGVVVFAATWGLLRWTGAGIWPKNLAVFEIGTMLGIWLSFGTRKPTLKFEELHILEEDRLEPVVRIAFSPSTPEQTSDRSPFSLAGLFSLRRSPKRDPQTRNSFRS
jgi:hypothetical protein